MQNPNVEMIEDENESGGFFDDEDILFPRFLAALQQQARVLRSCGGAFLSAT